jgi:hypothetical protein
MASGLLSQAQVDAWIKAGKPIAGRSDGQGLTFTLSPGIGSQAGHAR